MTLAGDPVSGHSGRPGDELRAAAESEAESSPTAAYADRRGTAVDHGRHPLRNPRALVVTSLRTKSVHAREILAELTWPGHTPQELLDWAESGDPWPMLREGQQLPWLGRSGQILAGQTGDLQERRLARRILEAVHAQKPLTGHLLSLLGQLRSVERDADAVDAIIAEPGLRAGARRSIEADRANPWLYPDGDASVWGARFNAELHSSALADLHVADTAGSGWEGAGAPIDRLQPVTPPEPVSAPYRVSVLMSTFRPGPELITAVRSVLQQSWTEFELLVIDDASGPGYQEILDHVAGLDPRIRVIRKAVNGGTYRARNTALRIATGQFCTTFDSDDYLHPHALELGMRRLLAEPDLMATRAEGVRVTPDLELTRPGYLPRMTAAGTLLFRRAEVMNRIGWFDPTSKGADTEFARRLTSAFGSAICDLGETVLFLRDGQTLSSGEFSIGWRHPARHEYKASYSRWHATIRNDRESSDPFLDPHEPRRFAEPRRWAKPVIPGLAARGPVDVCFAGDWRRFGGPQRSMLEEIAACRDAGLRVAVMHLEAFRFMTVKDLPLCDPVMELVEAGEVEWIQADDQVDIAVMLLRYPPILQYPPTLTADPVRIRHLFIVANQAPCEPDGSDRRYVVADVTQRATELFGVAPTWMPQGPGIRRLLRQQDPQVRLATWDNPGLIDLPSWHHRPPRPIGDSTSSTVVVGRYSRDNAIKFAPTLGEVIRGYDFPADYRVRIMGGPDTIARLAASAAEHSSHPDPAALPANWELLDQGQEEVTDFLAGLDFFLYLDNPDAHEAFGRVILEAAASGVLTIAHPKHREVFGDTIDYALPGQAQELIAGYVADPQRYAARVARTRQAVAQRFGRDSFGARMAELVNQSSAESEAELTLEPVPRPHPGSCAFHLASTGSPAPGLLVRSEAEHEVFSVPLRSRADAERADGLWVIHPPGPAHQRVVAEWVREVVVGPLAEGVGWVDPQWASPPDSVLAIVMLRERTIAWWLAEVTPLAPAGRRWIRNERPWRAVGHPSATDISVRFPTSSSR